MKSLTALRFGDYRDLDLKYRIDTPTFAFATFVRYCDAVQAIKHLNGFTKFGKKLRVEIASEFDRSNGIFTEVKAVSESRDEVLTDRGVKRIRNLCETIPTSAQFDRYHKPNDDMSESSSNAIRELQDVVNELRSDMAILKRASMAGQHSSVSATTRYDSCDIDVVLSINELEFHSRQVLQDLLPVQREAVLAYKWPEIPATATLSTIQLACREHFPRFMEHLQRTELRLTSAYEDRLDNALANRRKPDCAHASLRQACTPPNIRFTGVLVPRRATESFTATEKIAAIDMAKTWLSEENYRPWFHVYLTDLCNVQYFRVSRTGKIKETEIMRFASAESQSLLIALLTAGNDLIGISSLLRPVIFDDEEGPVPLIQFVGKGTTGIVFQDAQGRAVKLLPSPGGCEREFDIIKSLQSRSQIFKTEFAEVIQLCVPKVLMISDNHCALHYFPVGETQWDFHGLAFGTLVRFLELIHKCGWVHRDMSTANLVRFGTAIVPVDFGSIAPVSTEIAYDGTLGLASDRVLRLLSSGQHEITCTPQDDLHSLVRCAREALASNRTVFKRERHVLMAQSTDQSTVAGLLRDFWSQKLTGLVWEPLLAAAEELRYDRMAKLFESHMNFE